MALESGANVRCLQATALGLKRKLIQILPGLTITDDPGVINFVEVERSEDKNLARRQVTRFHPGKWWEDGCGVRQPLLHAQHPQRDQLFPGNKPRAVSLANRLIYRQVSG